MAFTPNCEHDIFISYARVDNKPRPPESEGWVDQFHRSLEQCLAEYFGRSNLISIWRDERVVAGHDLYNASIPEACRHSALLICVTSPGFFESSWCATEYAEFHAAATRNPLSSGNKSRVFNVRLRGVSREPHLTLYEDRFSDTIGYLFYKDDPYRPFSPNNDPDEHYWRRINELARNINDTLVKLKDDFEWATTPTCQYILELDTADPAALNSKAERYVASLRQLCGFHVSLNRVLENSTKLILDGHHEDFNKIEAGEISQQLGIRVRSFYPASLNAIMLTATENLVISGHTLNRFSKEELVSSALSTLVHKSPKMRITIIMMNPASDYSAAHEPFHLLESSGPSSEQLEKALDFFANFFETLREEARPRIEVLLSNYMPRFRATIVDNKTAYVYLYMYRADVNDYPDSVLGRDGQGEDAATRIVKSTRELIDAPETVPFIRNAELYASWRKSHLVKWSRWSAEAKYRQRITHQYYTVHAEKFHYRFGDPQDIELYVKDHLDKLKDRVLVLGCGSGKEVRYLSGRGKCDSITGMDFSPQAIALAKNQNRHDARFMVGDFYDLEHAVDGEFDGIVANAAFVHLYEPKDIKRLFRSVRRKLRPGGLFLLRCLYKASKGRPLKTEIHKADRFGSDRWFVYYSRTYLARLSEKTGYVVDDEVTREIAARRKPATSIEEIMKKGFPHRLHVEVKWPTLLLRRPEDK